MEHHILENQCPDPSLGKGNSPQHQATYTLSKRTGEILVRLIGPDACNAVGCEVPVKTKAGEVRNELLTEMILATRDNGNYGGNGPTGQLLALYRFKRRPRPKKRFVF